MTHEEKYHRDRKHEALERDNDKLNEQLQHCISVHAKLRAALFRIILDAESVQHAQQIAGDAVAADDAS
jgi:hypothetical protein